jgi:glycosyltransferase involved in cell wall biosynthesis
LAKSSIRRADGVIAVSRFVKDYVEQIIAGLDGKVDVIYNGNPVEGSTAANVAKSEVPFLLSASKFVAYANQLNLLDGYATLVRTNKSVPSLWLAGGVLDKKYFRKVQSLIVEKGLTEKVKLLGLVSHERMMQLYAGASAFLFPSTLEACPQTLIEAMAFGLPVAASNSPPMPEICRDAAIYFNPQQPDDIAEKIGMLVTNQTLKENLSEKALARCTFFNWDKTASELVKVFQKVSGNRQKIPIYSSVNP